MEREFRHLILVGMGGQPLVKWRDFCGQVLETSSEHVFLQRERARPSLPVNRRPQAGYKVHLYLPGLVAALQRLKQMGIRHRTSCLHHSCASFYSFSLSTVS